MVSLAPTVPNDDNYHHDQDDDDDDKNDNRHLVPVPLINPNGTDLPRPIATPLDPSKVQPKRLKLKVSTKRRKHHQNHKSASNNSTSTSTSNKSHSSRPKHKRKPTMQSALQSAARKGLEAMVELFDRREPEMIRRG